MNLTNFFSLRSYNCITRASAGLLEPAAVQLTQTRVLKMKRSQLLPMCAPFLLICAFATSAESADFSVCYAKAVEGKYQEAVECLDKMNSLTAEQMVFKALCLLGSDQGEKAKALAKEIWDSPDASVFFDIPKDIADGQVTKESENFKQLVAGRGECLLTIEGGVQGDRIVLVKTAGLDTNKKVVPGTVRAEQPQRMQLGSGSYDLYWSSHNPSTTWAPIEYSDNPNGILLGKLKVEPWEKGQKQQYAISSIEKIQLEGPKNSEALSPEDAIFKIDCASNVPFQVDFLAEPPNSISKDADVFVWTFKGTGKSIVHYNSDGKAMEPLKHGAKYKMYLSWPAPGSDEIKVFGRLRCAFTVKK